MGEPTPEEVAEMRYQLQSVKEIAARSIRDKEDELRKLERENEELKRLVAQQAAHSVGGRQQRVNELNTRLLNVKTELEGIDETRNRLRYQLDHAGEEKAQLERKLQAAQKVTATLEEELANSTAEAGRMESRLRQLEAEVASPIPRPAGENDATRRLLANIENIQEEQDRMRMKVRDAKFECDQKRAQLEVLANKLRAAAQNLAERDAEVRAAQTRTHSAIDYAGSRGDASTAQRVNDARAVVTAKDDQVAALARKAAAADHVLDDLVEFVRNAAAVAERRREAMERLNHSMPNGPPPPTRSPVLHGPPGMPMMPPPAMAPMVGPPMHGPPPPHMRQAYPPPMQPQGGHWDVRANALANDMRMFGAQVGR